MRHFVEFAIERHRVTEVNANGLKDGGGAFVAGALGVTAFVYAPFALFCWLSPLIGLIYAAVGWFVPKDPAGPQILADEDMEEIAADVEGYMV